MGAGCPYLPLRGYAAVGRNEARCRGEATGEREARLTVAPTRVNCPPKCTGWGAVVAMIHVPTNKTYFCVHFDKITMVLPNHGLAMLTVTQPPAWVGCYTITRLQAGHKPSRIVADATIAGTTVTAAMFHVEQAPSAPDGPLQGAAVVEVQGLRKWQGAAGVEVQGLRERGSAARNEAEGFC